MKNDGYIPGILSNDNEELAARATISATSNKDGGEPQDVVNGIFRKMGGKTNAWISDGISDAGETLTLKFDEEKPVSEVRLIFWSDFKYPIRITMSPNRQKQQRIGVPEELVKDYSVVLKNDGQVVKQVNVHNNHQRKNLIKFDNEKCDRVDVVVHITNGYENVVIFEVRVY